MKVYKNEDAIHHNRPEGIKAMYHLFKEYHFVYAEQPPHTTQPWHHHKIIHESLFIIDGELLLKWKEGNELRQQIVRSGDLIETENTSHSFTNQNDGVVRYIVIKQVLSGEDKVEVLERDRYSDED